MSRQQLAGNEGAGGTGSASLTANPPECQLPGRPVQRGRLHIATQVMRQIYAVFDDMGFSRFHRTREVEER